MFRTITPIFSVVLAIVIYFGFTSGLLQEIKTIQEETKAYEDAIAKGVEYNQKIERTLDVKRSLSALDTERFNAFVPSDIDEVRLLVDLQAMARTHNMLIGNLEVAESGATGGGDMGGSNVVGAPDFTTVDISFGLIGTYDQFRSMLANIEKSLTLIEVTNITLTTNEGPLQQFDVKIRAYALKSIEQNQLQNQPM